MNKNIFLLLFFIGCVKCFSQDFELMATPSQNSKVIYKDGSSEIGILRMASSVFDPRIKQRKGEKERKIDFKTIDRIITNPETEQERIFQYLNHNYNRFKIFVELVYIDVLSIYVGLDNPLDLFYSNYDRQSAGEKMNRARRNSGLYHPVSERRAKVVDTLHFSNNKSIAVPLGHSDYYDLGFLIIIEKNLRPRYYLLKEGNTKIYKTDRNKRFLKKAKEFIEGCSTLINDLEQENIDLKDIPRFIEYYKDICLTTTSEQN